MKNLKDIILEKLVINKNIKIKRNYDNWTIEDAKEGDIISSKYNTFIYKGLDEKKQYCNDKNAIVYYACYKLPIFKSTKRFLVGPDVGVGTTYQDPDQYYLSTEKECEALFNALKKEGYEWDDDKKELIKVIKLK